MQDLTYQFIRANGINLHVALAGPKNGEPVILLHGFPDASFGWELQIRALADAGFYVIAPDQRGYNLSDRPTGVSNYSVELLSADVLALATALNLPRFNLAGHDWGAIVSWALAGAHPELVKRLAILNVPHPAVMNKFLKTSRQQQLKSWYAFFFQLPLLPEIALRAFNWQMLTSRMSSACSVAELERYRLAWSQPGSLTAMLNWYRCLFQQPPKNISTQKISAPTLIIWGKHDPYLMWQMASESLALCADGQLEYIEDATHWVHQDRPQEVNRLLLAHFALSGVTL